MDADSLIDHVVERTSAKWARSGGTWPHAIPGLTALAEGAKDAIHKIGEKSDRAVLDAADYWESMAILVDYGPESVICDITQKEFLNEAKRRRLRV